MTDTTDLEQPELVKVGDWAAFRHQLDRFGGSSLYARVDCPEDLYGAGLLRHYADTIENLDDPDLPDRPAKAAAAIRVLADEVDQRPVEPGDYWLGMPDSERALIREWTEHCRDRSPLLEPLAECLGDLWWATKTKVGVAREALAMLADADLLLLGVDADLRPVLTRYAALPDGQVRK
jgi:hypothetical protein